MWVQRSTAEIVAGEIVNARKEKWVCHLAQYVEPSEHWFLHSHSHLTETALAEEGPGMDIFSGQELLEYAASRVPSHPPTQNQ